MRGRFNLLAAFAAAIACATSAHASNQNNPQRIVLHAGRLAEALRELSTRTGTGLLFDPTVVGDRRNRRVSSSAGVDDALRRLLEGSGLSFRRTDAGTIVIFVAAAATQQELAIPEILVIGRRTQNADIRRSENDIQPYQISTSHEIVMSHTDNVDTFLRTRLPSNASQEAASQLGAGLEGSNQSFVDLHGLGRDQSLVLVDGARMPGVPPSDVFTIEQPDLNAVPLLAIDRIETRTGTAGGIYGPGATGGVVNVVLRHDYRGVDLGATYGLSSQGDNPYQRVDALIGFSPDHDRTKVTLAISHAKEKGLRFSDRDFPLNAVQLLFEQNPIGTSFSPGPQVDGLIIADALQAGLSFKPAFGGQVLGAAFTYMPTGTVGIGADAGAALAANAGHVPTSLDPAVAMRTSLTTSTNVTSLLFNVRHEFSDRIEAFVDLIGLQNNGHAITGGQAQSASLLSTNPNNPFEQDIFIRFPLGGDGLFTTQLRTIRLSTGIIVQLPHKWRGDARYSWGKVDRKFDDELSPLNSDFQSAMQTGLPGAAGEPALNPFGDWTAFLSSLGAYKTRLSDSIESTNHFEDATLQLAGPIFSTRAGPVSLSLIGEGRRENVSQTISAKQSGVAASERLPSLSQTVWSAYGELRAPVIPRNSGPWPLHGLEFQLAARYDQIHSAGVPNDFTILGDFAGRQTATTYTAGLRLFPLDQLMVRASLSTGVIPPTLRQLIYVSFVGFVNYEDPKRGNTPIGTEAPYQFLNGGSPDLRPSRAHTFSAGLVLNPEAANRPRISLDYTRIDMRDEIIGALRPSYFLQNEDRYPGRIQRAPLSAADIAKGYTGGVVTQLDARATNAGRTSTDVIDLLGDYSTHLSGSGSLRFYGALTYEPRLRRQSFLDVPPGDQVGFARGPLRLRGYAGIDWNRDPFSVTLNGQYYYRYFAAFRDLQPIPQADSEKAGVRIPPQFYVDLSAAYRFGSGVRNSRRTFELQVGVRNLFNHAPPIATSSSQGYSFYGDPVKRRFEATLLAHF